MAKHRRPDDPCPPRPSGTTWRTVVIAAVGLLPLLPDIARVADVDTVPAVASTLAVIAAINRILALPAVDDWLDRNARWLSVTQRSRLTDPPTPPPTADPEDVTT